jgi:aspartate/tyrosine/aromatic aminotransferase
MVMDFATINRDGVVMLYGCCKNPGLKSLWLGLSV